MIKRCKNASKNKQKQADIVSRNGGFNLAGPEEIKNLLEFQIGFRSSALCQLYRQQTRVIRRGPMEWNKPLCLLTSEKQTRLKAIMLLKIKGPRHQLPEQSHNSSSSWGKREAKLLLSAKKTSEKKKKSIVMCPLFSQTKWAFTLLHHLMVERTH